MNDCFDTETLLRLREDDRAAFMSLYDFFYFPLFNYGFKLCRDQELVRDCINKVMLKLWEKRRQVDEIKNVASYLHTCVRNEILTEYKSAKARSRRHQLVQNAQDDTEQSYEERIIEKQQNILMRDRIRKALAHLSGRQKELLELRFYHEMDYDQIAASCGISKRTVYNIIHEALKVLRSALYE